jgi:hypothetical protein
MRRALGVLALLAACSSPPQPPEPPDAELGRLSRTGQRSFQQGRFEQAATLFADALARARVRDDPRAIGDMATNLAIAQLRNREDAKARDTAAQVRAELGRRGAPVPAELTLAEATARWRLGEAEAAALAREAAATASTAPRASFLLGLIAADARDEAGLAAARGAVTDAGDRAELDARAALLAGDGAGAKQAFLRAAAARQDVLDYAAMGRALAGAAAAQPSAPDAADLYLRAGRAAAGDRDRANAERWLAEAARAPGATGRDARAQGGLRAGGRTASRWSVTTRPHTAQAAAPRCANHRQLARRKQRGSGPSAGAASVATARSTTPQPCPVHCAQAPSTQRPAKRKRRSAGPFRATASTKPWSTGSGAPRRCSPSASTRPSSRLPVSARALGQASGSLIARPQRPANCSICFRSCSSVGRPPRSRSTRIQMPHQRGSRSLTGSNTANGSAEVAASSRASSPNAAAWMALAILRLAESSSLRSPRSTTNRLLMDRMLPASWPARSLRERKHSAIVPCWQ